MNLRRVVVSVLVLFTLSFATGCASTFASGGGAESAEASSSSSTQGSSGYDWQAAADARRQQGDADQATADQIADQITQQSQQMVQQQQDSFAQQQQLDQQVLSEQPGSTP